MYQKNLEKNRLDLVVKRSCKKYIMRIVDGAIFCIFYCEFVSFFRFWIFSVQRKYFAVLLYFLKDPKMLIFINSTKHENIYGSYNKTKKPMKSLQYSHKFHICPWILQAIWHFSFFFFFAIFFHFLFQIFLSLIQDFSSSIFKRFIVLFKSLI